MKPWKRRRHAKRTWASRMLQWGHGDEAVEEFWIADCRLRIEIRFNGATAMKPWKRSGGVRVTWPTPRQLQWGHGDEAVEELGPSARAPRNRRLQWGHGDEAVEEAQFAAGIDSAMAGLQWGHGDEAVEEESVRIIDVGLVLASMGPRR